MKNNKKLNQVELDFIDFMSEKTSRQQESLKKIFIQLRDRYKFNTPGYAGLTGDVAHLYRMLYDTDTEENTIRCYQFHALLNLYRFISYTYAKPKGQYIKEFWRDMKKGQFRNLINFLRRKLLKVSTATKKNKADGSISEFLLSKSKPEPVVVDYGCGLAGISFEMAQIRKEARVYLVDVDCITLDFMEYRFGKHARQVESIRITPDNIYPDLPPHDICIIREVLEHVHKPLMVCENILKSLNAGGVMYGNFNDHNINMYHISADLSNVRTWLKQHFDQIGPGCYRKR